MILRSSIAIFLFVFTLFNNNIHANEKEGYKNLHGFSFGFTFGKFANNFIGQGFQTGVSPGLSFGYKNLKGINSHFSRSFELIYIQKAARFSRINPYVKNVNISTGDESDAEDFIAYSFNYLELPLIIYWQPGGEYLDHRSDIRKVNVKLGVGFSPALSIGAKYKYNKYTADEPTPGPFNLPVAVTEEHFEEKHNYAKKFVGNFILDLHLALGHGPKSTFFINTRYNRMLNSIFVDEHRPAKLHSFVLAVGWIY